MHGCLVNNLTKGHKKYTILLTSLLELFPVIVIRFLISLVLCSRMSWSIKGFEIRMTVALAKGV